MPASVKVTVEAITAGARKSIDRVQGEVTELGATATVAANRVSSLAGEISDVGRNAIASSISIGAFATAATAASLSVGALLTTLLPLAGVLGAVALALAGVVAGFGAVIGTGILAWGDGFTKAMQDVKAELRAVATDIGSQFVPLVKDAVNALPAFIRNVRESIGSLQPFADALRSIGATAFRVIPQMIQLMMELGRFILPAFTDITNAILNGLHPAFSDFANIAIEISDEVFFLADAIGQAIPVLFRFGTVVLNVVLDGLVSLTRIISRVIGGVRDFANSMGQTQKPALTAKKAVDSLRASLSFLERVGKIAVRGLRTAFSIIGTVLQTVVTQFQQNRAQIRAIINNTVTTVMSIVRVFSGQFRKLFQNLTQGWQRFWRNNKSTILGITRNLTKLLIGIFTDVTDAIRRLWQNHGKKTVKTIRKRYQQIQRAIRTLVTIALGIIGPFLKQLRQFWQQNGDQIMFIVRALVGTLLTLFRKLMSVVTGIIKVGTDILRGIWERWGHSIKAFVSFIFDAIFAVIGTVIDGIATTIKAGLKLMEGDWRGALNLLKGLAERIFDGILNFVEKWVDNVIRAIKWAIDGIIGWFESLYQDLIGGSIIPNLLNDIISAVKNWNLVSMFGGIIDDLIRTFKSLPGRAADVAQDAASRIVNTFNRILPNSISIPQVGIGGGGIDLPSATIAGETIGGGELNVPRLSVGGQSIDIPQLQTGGFIQEAGFAFLHANEQVVPAARVDRSRKLDTSEQTRTENNFEITVHADSNANGRTLAKDITRELRSRNFNGQ